MLHGPTQGFKRESQPGSAHTSDSFLALWISEFATPGARLRTDKTSVLKRDVWKALEHPLPPSALMDFFLKILKIFLARGEGREKERDRNINA